MSKQLLTDHIYQGDVLTNLKNSLTNQLGVLLPVRHIMAQLSGQVVMKNIKSYTIEGDKKSTGHAQEGFKIICKKCGAIRVDAQVGL